MLHSDDPRADGAPPDLTSRLMWIASGVVGVVVLALPGSSRAHLAWALALFARADEILLAGKRRSRRQPLHA